MPIYPTKKTYWGGFYNNKRKDGVDDRVYSAVDIRKPYDVIYSDGVKPDDDGTAGKTLKVSPAGHLTISVSAGHAKLGGAWFENKSDYVIKLDSATSSTRYDCVIVRNDDSDDVREPIIYIKSLDHKPSTIGEDDNSDVVRNENVYEICLGYIIVTSTTGILDENDIVDTRTTPPLCNTMSGVGSTIVKAQKDTYLTRNTNEQNITIPSNLKFNMLTDELEVWVEGIKFSENSQYTVLNNSTIKLTIPLPLSGTKIEFVVRKNVNGVANENVNGEVAQLTTDVSNIKKVLTHDYYCGGVNDNVLIGNLVRELLTGAGYGSVRLNIHGSFGAYQPAIVGSTTDYWFDFSGTSDRRVVVDFTDCSQIITPITSGKTSVVFYGKKIDIVGANLIVNNTAENTSIVVIDGSAEIVNCENCRFWLTGDKYTYISRHGTFTNCRGSVTNSKYYSYCFYTQNLVKLFGGEYYAYTADNSNCAVVGQTGSTSVTIMYGVNAPTIERAGYYQKSAVHHVGTAGNAGVICCTDLITTLPVIEHNGTDNFRGTIALNKPNMM